MARQWETLGAGAQERVGVPVNFPVIGMNPMSRPGGGQYGGQDEEIEVIDLDSNRAADLKPHTWGKA